MCSEILKKRRKDRNEEQSHQPAAATARFNIQACCRPKGSLLELMNLFAWFVLATDETQWLLRNLDSPRHNDAEEEQKKKQEVEAMPFERSGASSRPLCTSNTRQKCGEKGRRRSAALTPLRGSFF